MSASTDAVMFALMLFEHFYCSLRSRSSTQRYAETVQRLSCKLMHNLNESSKIVKLFANIFKAALKRLYSGCVGVRGESQPGGAVGVGDGDRSCRTSGRRRNDGLLRSDRLDRRRRPAKVVRERRANPPPSFAARRSYRILHR